MNPLIQLKTITPPLLITLTLLCFGLLPKAQAVAPPPDGGYPGNNTAEGNNALFGLTMGVSNTAVGFFSLFSDTTGSNNTAVGAATLALNTGEINTAIGAGALFSNTTGTGNTATGSVALFNNTAGGSNTALGLGAGSNVTTANNVICIGARVSGANTSNTCFIGNVSGVGIMGDNVKVTSSGQLGVAMSSARFKQNIKPMENASESILALKPVTFRYKKEIDPDGIRQFGLVAEDVEKVNPDLVGHGADGKVYTVRYEAVNAMLLNEFLKEHRTVQEQQKEIDALKAELKEQKALIQKVSDKVELHRPAPQIAVNDQ
jgi:hypothetical protein